MEETEKTICRKVHCSKKIWREIFENKSVLFERGREFVVLGIPVLVSSISFDEKGKIKYLDIFFWGGHERGGRGRVHSWFW